MTGLEPAALADVPGLVRCEAFNREALGERITEMTHAVYPHDQVYGPFCTVQAHIDCPPERLFARPVRPGTYDTRRGPRDKNQGLKPGH